MKDLHQFLISPSATTKLSGPHDRIVISSRVRLARNLREHAFPGWAKKPERVKVLETIQPAVCSLPEMADSFSEAMDNLGALDKSIDPHQDANRDGALLFVPPRNRRICGRRIISVISVCDRSTVAIAGSVRRSRS